MTTKKQPHQHPQPATIDQELLPPELADALEGYADTLHADGDDAFFQSLERQLRGIPDQAPPEVPLWRRPFWQWSGYLAMAAAAVMLLLALPPSVWQPSAPRSDIPPQSRQPSASVQPPASARQAQRRPTQKQPPARANGPQPRRRSLAMLPKGLSLQLFAISRKTRYKQKILVRDGEILYSGDQIQFAYTAPQSQGSGLTIAIFSLNQRGEVAVFYPGRGAQSLRLELPQGTFPALELDEYVGLERIFALTSPTPFSLKAAKRALIAAYQRAEGKLQAPFPVNGPWQVTWSLLLQKRNAPRP